ncbi:hypothetical protein BH10ACI2_BH10ACI2_21120 [soil metagenome]
MKKALFTVFVLVVLAVTSFAQKTKPWTEWSKKDADKILNDSAWGQTITKGEAPPSMSRDANAGRNTGASAPSSSELPTEVNYRVRLMSAKPIREGVARKILLSQSTPTKDLTDQLQGIIDKDLGDFIVVAVNVDGQNPATVNGNLMMLSRMNTAFLSEKAYIERKDGKRMPLVEYRPPIADNMGGKFIFARTLDGKSFVSPETESVRFVLNGNGNLKLDVKFKVSGMTYGDRLEY